MSNAEERRFVEVDLRWLIENPTGSPTAGLTGYRQCVGVSDLFSIYVRFSNPDPATGHWREAKIYPLVSEMDSRLPAIGEVLVVTAGVTPVAEAKIRSVGSDVV